jgi:hypothetical protein
LLALDAPEFRLAVFCKNFGNGLVGGFDDSLIQIDMLPANLPREQARDGRFSAAHEARQADDRPRARINCHKIENMVSRGVVNQSRLRMLIVPSKDVNSTLARP